MRAMRGCPRVVESVFDSDADLSGDPRDIQSVVSNLVSNAVRYTPEDGSIEVRWWTQPSPTCWALYQWLSG